MFWPNVDAGSDGTSMAIRSFRELKFDNNIHYFKNMEPNDFLKLLANSKCLIGNSSVGIRECAYLGVPVVNIGIRQNRRERGMNVIDVDYEKEAIKNAINTQLAVGHYASDHIYGNGNSGKAIANILSTVNPSIKKVIAY
jgi:UDP-N-acetylglucosamine 2-epimerase